MLQITLSELDSEAAKSDNNCRPWTAEINWDQYGSATEQSVQLALNLENDS